MGIYVFEPAQSDFSGPKTGKWSKLDLWPFKSQKEVENSDSVSPKTLIPKKNKNVGSYDFLKLQFTIRFAMEKFFSWFWILVGKILMNLFVMFDVFHPFAPS